LDGIDVFAFSNLTSYDNWLPAWNYANNYKVPSCTDTEPIYLNAYNICSHEDCKKYPFLSQVDNLSILLPDKLHKCTFQNGYLKRESVDYEYNFWKQRINAPDGECKVGEKIHSGNFIWDQSIYATCSNNQPFVFCPSSKTEGIELVQGMKYACKFPEKDFVINYKLPKNTVSFKPNELLDMMGDGALKVNKKDEILKHGQQFAFKEKEKVELSGDGRTVNLRFRYKHTYPPDVYYEIGKDPKLNNKGEFTAFLFKVSDFTTLPVEFPKHNAQILLPDYKQDGK
jgi:hypothetical protein